MNLTRYIYYKCAHITSPFLFVTVPLHFLIKKREKLHFLSLPFSRIRNELRVDDENVLVATPITIFWGDSCVHVNWSQYVERSHRIDLNEFKIVEHTSYYLIETQKRRKNKKMLVTITNAGSIRTKRELGTRWSSPFLVFISRFVRLHLRWIISIRV